MQILPAWLWPRTVSATPNGIQRLGRVLHWGLSGIALILKGFGVLVAAGALFAVVKSASWELVGFPVPKDLRRVEMTLETPFEMKPVKANPFDQFDSNRPSPPPVERTKPWLRRYSQSDEARPITRVEVPASTSDEQFKAKVVERARWDLWGRVVPEDQIADFRRISQEAAASDWKVTRKSTDSTRAQERSLTKARARIELRRARAALPDAITTALGLMLGALASALVGRASRYVISGE
jgi:hypothetical protein